MSALTPAQIEQYAYNAGFRGDALKLAVAVAVAESGGNPAAYNPESAAGTKAGSGSRGLWQIYGTAHPQYNNNAVYDPQLNANAAYTVYKNAGETFRPWSTYLNGAAQRISQSLNLPNITGTTATAQYVANPTAPLGTTGASVPVQSTNTPQMSNLLGSVSNQLAGDAASSILPPNLGVNLALGFGGFILVIFGFVLLARTT